MKFGIEIDLVENAKQDLLIRLFEPGLFEITDKTEKRLVLEINAIDSDFICGSSGIPSFFRRMRRSDLKRDVD
jgi:hypothetical protein